jgi:aerobic-type carbon monoxide dehydrogenase small subunit (CoxS/CutS family)
MRIRFTVNGNPASVEVPPLKKLLDVLREDLGLLGTKGACRNGFCGTCLVLMGEDLVNSCQIPAFRAQNQQITTAEGLSDSKAYAALKSSLGEQRLPTCRYCAPAYLVAMTALLSKNRNPTDAEIREIVSSILCVCSGHRGFLDGVNRT